MFVTRTWYVIGWADELSVQPFTRTVCGEPVALFRDDKGVAQAISAICPHRGADLGQGRVVGGTLECPFHGFRFNGKGACVRIPSQAADKAIPPHARAAAFPLVEQQGLLWIWPERDAEPDRAPESYPFLDKKAMPRRYRTGPILLEASYLNAMENALDGGHLAFVHTTSLPGASEEVGDYEITVSRDQRRFRATDRTDYAPNSLETDPDREKLRSYLGYSWRLLKPLLSPFLEISAIQKSGFYYDLSGMVYFDTHYSNGKSDYLLAFFTPSDEARTWAFGAHFRNRANNFIGDWLIKRYVDELFREDEEILRKIMPVARGAGGLPRPVLVKGGYTSAPFRRIYAAALRREQKKVPWQLAPLRADKGETIAG